jgi:hypothetical protein
MLSNLLFISLYFLVFTAFILTILYVILSYFSLRSAAKTTTVLANVDSDTEVETEVGVEATETGVEYEF